MSCAHTHALRIGRRSEFGRVYLVTAGTRNREPFFVDWAIAATTARVLASDAAWPESRLLCWVLMPDHWHAVIELGGETVSVAIGRAKAMSSQATGRAIGRPLPLWAPGYHERALRRDESLLRVARYVVANPLRAGLVGRLGDYPLWNAVWMDRQLADGPATGGGRCGVERPLVALMP